MIVTPDYSIKTPQTLINALDGLLQPLFGNPVIDKAPDSFLPVHAEDKKESGTLSTAHIPRKRRPKCNYVIEGYTEGGLIAVKPTEKRRIVSGGGKRGTVRGFSKASRRRLLRSLARLKRAVLPLFVTLTYPADYPTALQSKTDLEKFLKNLKYRFPEICGIWKYEKQKRGAPHYHLFIYGASYQDLLEYVPGAWFRIAGDGDPNHLKWHKGELNNEPCVQQLKSYKQAMIYASKYLGKVENDKDVDSGRVWGMFGRKFLPFSELYTVEITESQAINLMRYMRRYARLRGRDYPSMTILCNKPLAFILAIYQT